MKISVQYISLSSYNIIRNLKLNVELINNDSI